MRLTLFTFLLMALFINACDGKGEVQRKTAEGPAIKVSVLKIESVDIPEFSENIGTVKAVREAVVSSKVMGSVSELNFREGERVRDGSTLIYIDDRELKAQLEQALAAGTEAAAAYKNAEVSLARTKSLLEQISATQQQLDNALMQFDMAEARVRQSRANTEALKVLLDYTRIKAPFDGVITAKLIETGETATPGRPLFRITDDRALRFETWIMESDIAKIKAGQALNVRVDSIDKVIKGRVSQIIPSGDLQTHSFLVKVDLPGTENLLPGMFGRVYLDKGVAKVIVVPKNCIIEKGQLTGVFVVKGNVAQYRLFKKGLVTGEGVEVLSGLNEGEEIAIGDLDRLVDGSRVESIK